MPTAPDDLTSQGIEMEPRSSNQSSRRPKILAALLGLLALGVFIGNILIGKYRLATGTGTAAPLDGVPEFLILYVSISLFVVCMFFAEIEERQQK